MKEDMYNDCHSLNDDRLMVNFALNHDICANLDDRLDEKIDGMLTKMMMMMMMMTKRWREGSDKISDQNNFDRIVSFPDIVLVEFLRVFYCKIVAFDWNLSNIFG